MNATLAVLFALSGAAMPPPPRPTVISGVHLEYPDDARIVAERMVVDCSSLTGGPCTFELTTDIRSAGAEGKTVAVVVGGFGLTDVSATVEGKPAPPAGAESAKAVLTDLCRHWRYSDTPRATERCVAQATKGGAHGAYRLSVEAGAEAVRLVITGRFAPQGRRGGWVLPAAVARHLILGGGRSQGRVQMGYLPARGTPSKLSVRGPSGWSVAGGEVAVSGTGKVVPFSMEEHRIFYRGGPLLGLGGALGPGSGFRARFGYEVAAPSWLLYSLTLDTDFTRHLTLAATVEAASPALIIIPSVGIGVGLPVQVLPETLVGARVQASLQFAAVGFVTSLDIFPDLGSGADMLRWTLLFQIAI